MQNLKFLGAVAALALASGAAYAQPPAGFQGEARLAAPAAAPQAAEIAGVAWRCEGEQCFGSATRKANLDGLVKECRRVVAVIGPVSSYKSRGRELTAGQVRACNRAAIRIETAQN